MTARLASVCFITSVTCVCATAQDGVGSLRTAIELEERSLAASGAGRNQEAETLAARALRIREARLGVGHSATTPALAAPGVAFGAAGKLAEAVWAMEQVVELRSRALGSEHPALAADLYYLGQFQLALGHPDAAAEALDRVDGGRQREAKGLQKRLARALGNRTLSDELPPPTMVLDGDSLQPQALAARERDRP